MESLTKVWKTYNNFISAVLRGERMPFLFLCQDGKSCFQRYFIMENTLFELDSNEIYCLLWLMGVCILGALWFMNSPVHAPDPTFFALKFWVEEVSLFVLYSVPRPRNVADLFYLLAVISHGPLYLVVSAIGI